MKKAYGESLEPLRIKHFGMETACLALDSQPGDRFQEGALKSLFNALLKILDSTLNISPAMKRKISLTLFSTAGTSLTDWAESGSLRRELAIYEKLHGNGIGINIVSYSGQRDSEIARELQWADVLSTPWHRRQSLTAAHLAAGYFSRLAETDVFKTNQIRGAQVPVWLKKVFRKQLIVRCGFLHARYTRLHTPEDSHRIEEAERLERAAFRAADLGIVTTPLQRETVIDSHGIDPDRVVVIPNYVETDIFRPDPAAEKDHDLVFVGRGDRVKNLSALLEALTILKDTGLNVSLLLAGGCCRAKAIREKVEETGLDVCFAGDVPNTELPSLLNRAKSFILPSVFEHHPKALLEAMSCGLACIGADVTGIREEIVQGRNGLLSNNDPHSLADAISSLLGDAKLRRTLGEEARSYVVSNYDINRIAAMELDAIRKVLGR